MMAADRHKIKPKAVRMPGGLLAWYEDFAGASAEAVNAVLVRALEEFRARNGGATAPAEGATTEPNGATTRKPPRQSRERSAGTAGTAARTVTPAAEGVPPVVLQPPGPEPAPARQKAQCKHPGVGRKQWCRACEAFNV